MKIKFLVTGLACAFLISCASVQYQKGKSKFNVSYVHLSFDEVWNAAIKSVDDLTYRVREAKKETGFIYAKPTKYTHFGKIFIVPPPLKIDISKRNGRIRVDCLPIVPHSFLPSDKRYAKWFINALNNNLIDCSPFAVNPQF